MAKWKFALDDRNKDIRIFYDGERILHASDVIVIIEHNACKGFTQGEIRMNIPNCEVEMDEGKVDLVIHDPANNLRYRVIEIIGKTKLCFDGILEKEISLIEERIEELSSMEEGKNRNKIELQSYVNGLEHALEVWFCCIKGEE